MIKFDKASTMKISFDKSEIDILSLHILQYIGQKELGIINVTTNGNELELAFISEGYKHRFFDTMKGIIKSTQQHAANNWKKNELNYFSNLLKRAKQNYERKNIDHNVEYFMGILYEMRQNGVLAKDTPAIAHPPVKGIVLQGGGVKGLAYLGALKEMEKTGALEEAEFVCGSSAGAINALLIATGLSADQIKQYCSDFDTRNLMDARESSLGEYQAGGLGSIIKGIFQTMGAYGQANTAREFLRNILLHLTGDADITFAELEELRKINPAIKEFLCTATLLPEKGMGAGKTRIFSHKTSPNVLVADAVLASMSLPAVWAPVEIKQKVYRSAYQFHFESIGTYSDGGIHNNLPVDVANQFVRNNEYQMIPRNGKDDFVLDNPCVLSFSLCTAKQLNQAICPVPQEVKTLAIRNNQHNAKCFDSTYVTKDQQELAQYDALPIPSTMSPTSGKQHRRVSIHMKAEPSNIIRLVSIIAANQVEDAAEKNKLHNEGSILLYDNGISAAMLGLSAQQKNELIQIGAKTTQAFFFDKKDPTKEYDHPELYRVENFDHLNNDDKRNQKLDTLFMALVKEYNKYFQSGATVRGYSWEKMEKNIKIQNLYWKIHNIYKTLESKPLSFDEFMSIKLYDAFLERKKKEDFNTEVNVNLYEKLTDLTVIKNDLLALIKQKPFDAKEFFTRFAALGADTIVHLANNHHILLLTAAMTNPKALEIMLTHIQKAYMSLHQVPKIAESYLGKPRMAYEETKKAYKRLVNMSFRGKHLIFHCIDAGQPKSVQALLQHQVSQKMLYQGKSIFQYAIEKGKIDCFLKACTTTSNNEIKIGYKSITKQYDTKDFVKFMTYGFQNRRTLAHSLFELDRATLNRALQELMKTENEAIWDEFKKVLHQPDASGVTPAQLGLDKLDDDVFVSLFFNEQISSEQNRSNPLAYSH